MSNQETREFWDAHQEEMKNMRRRRRQEFWKVIKEFRRLGFEVRQISDYQFRFNNRLDVYPSNKRYRDLEKKVWGDIRGINYRQFLKQFFGVNYQIKDKKLTISV